MILLPFQIFNFLEYKTSADNLSMLKALSFECFQARNINTCTFALQKIEEYQIITGFNENYSCQTSLLGLEAKIIMRILNMRKGRTYLENFDDVVRACTPFS